MNSSRGFAWSVGRRPMGVASFRRPLAFLALALLLAACGAEEEGGAARQEYPLPRQ